MSTMARVLTFLARKQRPLNLILSSGISKIKRVASCIYTKKQQVTFQPHHQYFTPISLSSISLVIYISEIVVLV